MRFFSETHRLKLSKALTGRKLSEETKAKMRAAHLSRGESPLKGRKLSPEHREKIKAAFAARGGVFTGRKHSLETREKIRAAALERNKKVQQNGFECAVYWIHDNTCSDQNLHGYIGITTWPDKRKREHAKSQRFPENFKFTVLFTGTIEQCIELEQKLRPVPFTGWNIGVGGSSPRLGAKHSEESKKKLSDLNKGKRLSPETIAKMIAKTTGQKRPKEFGEAVRQRLLGKPSRIKGTHLSDEARLNMSKAQKGRIITPEHAAKIAATLTGHVRTAESRTKQSASAKGKPKSPEWRKWMSENATKRFATPEGRQSQIEKSAKGVEARRRKREKKS